MIGEVQAESAATVTSQRVTVSIRPEQMEIMNGGAASPGRNRWTGQSVETTFLGEASEHDIDVNGCRLRVIAAPPRFEIPQQVAIEFDPHDVVVLPQ